MNADIPFGATLGSNMPLIMKRDRRNLPSTFKPSIFRHGSDRECKRSAPLKSRFLQEPNDSNVVLTVRAADCRRLTLSSLEDEHAALTNANVNMAEIR
jgi:hypothetical protein